MVRVKNMAENPMIKRIAVCLTPAAGPTFLVKSMPQLWEALGLLIKHPAVAKKECNTGSA